MRSAGARTWSSPPGPPRKSRCFQIPIAEAVADPVKPGTALLLYPTKALAHDQLRSLTELELPQVHAGTYDGDATGEERAWMREHANVVLTNPEMIHAGLLLGTQSGTRFSCGFGSS